MDITAAIQSFTEGALRLVTFLGILAGAAVVLFAVVAQTKARTATRARHARHF